MWKLLRLQTTTLQYPNLAIVYRFCIHIQNLFIDIIRTLLLNLEQSLHYNRPLSAHQRTSISNNEHQHHLGHVLCQWCGYSAPPCTVSIPSLSCWICRRDQSWSGIANDDLCREYTQISIRERPREKETSSGKLQFKGWDLPLSLALGRVRDQS